MGIFAAREARATIRLVMGFALTALLMKHGPDLANGQINPLAVVPADRVLAPVDNNVTVTLPGNIPLQARPENDAGPVPPNYPMPHLVLVLKRDAAQQAA